LNKNEKVFNLPYAFRIKMCDEAERRLTFLLSKSKEFKVPCTRPLTLKDQSDAVQAQCTEMSVATELIFDAFEQKINKYEAFVQDQCKRIGEMQADINKKVDMCHVLTFVAGQSNQLKSYQVAPSSDMAAQPLLDNAGVNISFVAGTVKAGEEPMRMARMLFRITRGKALTHFSESFKQEGTDKCCYLVVFQDGQQLRDRVTKICDSFMGSRFDVPSLGD
jgi:hypothetical protein